MNVDISDIRVCSGGSCYVKNNSTLDFPASFSMDSILFDVRINPSIFRTPENLKLLRDSNVLQDWQNWNYLYKQLFHIVLSPSDSVKKDIEEEKQKLVRPHTFGIQVRTGGNLANDFEKTSMISEEALHRIPDQILEICQKNDVIFSEWNLYISSDSDKATKYLLETFQSKFNVVYSTKYKHGHTCPEYLKQTSLISALIDLHILGDSDILLTTRGSGFGRIASAMVYPNPSYFIPVNRTYVNRTNVNKQL